MAEKLTPDSQNNKNLISRIKRAFNPTYDPSRRGLIRKAAIIGGASLLGGREVIDIKNQVEGNEMGFNTQPLSGDEFKELEGVISEAYHSHRSTNAFPEILRRINRLNGIDEEFQNLWKVNPNRGEIDDDFSFFKTPSVEFGDRIEVGNNESDYPFLGRPVIKVNTSSAEGGLKYFGFRLADIDPKLVASYNLKGLAVTLSNGEKIIFVNGYNKANAALFINGKFKPNLGFNLVKIPRSEYPNISAYKERVFREEGSLTGTELVEKPTPAVIPVEVRKTESPQELLRREILQFFYDNNTDTYLESDKLRIITEGLLTYRTHPTEGNIIRNHPSLEKTTQTGSVIANSEVMPVFGVVVSRRNINSVSEEFWISDQNIGPGVDRYMRVNTITYQVDKDGNKTDIKVDEDMTVFE